MKTEEAIDIINNAAWLGTDNGIKVYPAIRVAVDALKKQIPMKPKYELVESAFDSYGCPICGKTLRHETFYGMSGKKTKYCPDCGQAIDWRNEK